MAGSPMSRSGCGLRRCFAAVLLSVVLAGCSSSPPTPSPSPEPAAPAGSRSAYAKLFDQVREDGTVSRETALQAFAVAFAPLPGVSAPVGGPPQPHERLSGTFAINWLRPYWNELAPDQRAVIERVLALDPGRTIVRRAASDQIVLAGFRQASSMEQPYLDALADAAKAYAQKLGRPLSIDYSLSFNKTAQKDESTGVAATTIIDLKAFLGVPFGECEIRVEPWFRDGPQWQPELRSTMAHEMFHCFQFDLEQQHGIFLHELPKWVEEGEAEWAAQATLGPSPSGAAWWFKYLQSPDRSLFARTYDASGFYEHLLEVGIDPWKRLDAILLAEQNEAGFKAAGAAGNDYLDTWAAGLIRNGVIGGAWNAIGRWGELPGATPAPTPLGVGDYKYIETPQVTNVIWEVQSHADIVETRIEGHARLHSGELEAVGLEQRFVCTRPDRCTCQDGESYDGPDLEQGAPVVLVALSGGLTGLGRRRLAGGPVIGHGLDEYCHERQPQAGGVPCLGGCGASDGDPHLQTINRVRYDLQAAGEYVLLRSPDRGVEIQVRQEPVPGRRGVAFNTAVAAKVNGHRVGIYPGSAGLELRIDGDPTEPTAAVLGPGASVTRYASGYELRFPDGTILWVVAVDIMNLRIAPSDGMRRHGSGLLAEVRGKGMRVPALPDGTTLPRPADDHERYQFLYERLAPAWRVTVETSLFDYAPGESPATFAIAGFPAEEDLRTFIQIDPAARDQAEAVCAAIGDGDLREACVYDVAVTGETTYAEVYEMTEAFQETGSVALGPPATPPATPEPTASPSAGALPAGFHLIGEPLHGWFGSAVGPDGLLYSSVLGVDDLSWLLVVDPQTGAVVRKAKVTLPGVLAFASGSVWIGEFRRRDGGCMVARLDPVSLREQAAVAIPCHPFRTSMAALDDAIWFIDATGTDDKGHGGQLRRIDPASNTLGQAVALPYFHAVATVRATNQALFYGNPDNGAYRLRSGGDRLEPVGPRFAFTWPVGDGVWAQQDTSAGYFTTAGTPDQQVEVAGQLVGADPETLFVRVSDGVEELWRYPLDGNVPEFLAASTTVATAAGPVPLPYTVGIMGFAEPLLHGDGVLIAIWLVNGADSAFERQLIIQTISLP